MMQAVQVLIERMKSHPEDFFDGIDPNQSLRNPKFIDITQKLDDLVAADDKVKPKNYHRLWFLNEDETTALLDAYKEARRVRFEAQIFHTLMRPEPNKVEGPYTTAFANSMVNTKNAITGTLLSGFADARGVFGSAPIKAEGSSVK
jgi:hypothetical protein